MKNLVYGNLMKLKWTSFYLLLLFVSIYGSSCECGKSDSNPVTPGHIQTFHGLIMYTTDGGATWDIDSNVYAQQRVTDFCILNPGNFHIIADGNVRISSDLGETWQSQTNPGTEGIFVRIINTMFPGTGFASGYKNNISKGIIYKTVDNGLNWSNVYTGSLNYNGHAIISSIDSYYPEVIGVTGDTVVYSPNNGVTWITTDVVNSSEVLSKANITQTHCSCIVTERGNVYYSNNSGSSWQLRSNVNLNGGLIKDCKFMYNNHIGLLCSEDQIFRTSDEGVTWTSVFQENDKFESLYIDYNICAVVGSNYVLKSNDMGLTWTRQNYGSHSYFEFNKVYFQSDGMFGYVTGTAFY